LIAKTAEPHPRLEGTVFTAAAQIEAAGGRALPVVGDIRDEDQVAAAIAQAVERFGGPTCASTTPRRSTCPAPEAIGEPRPAHRAGHSLKGTPT
jgi:NAD(P)-dependent dehydrogenase (short-subunit alcohol dehydrogenase family)